MRSTRLTYIVSSLLAVLLVATFMSVPMADAQTVEDRGLHGSNEMLAAAPKHDETVHDETVHAEADFFALKASIVDLSTGAISTLQSVPAGSPLDLDPGILFEPGNVDVRANGLSISGTGTGFINHPSVAAEPLEVRYSTDFTIGREPFRVVTGEARFLQGTEEVAYLDRNGLRVPEADEPPPPMIADAACEMDLPVDQSPVSREARAFVDQQVSLGGFPLTIISAEGSADALNGTGSIDVPHMEAPLSVAFSGLAINAANEAYAGTATATQDKGAGEIRADLLTNYDQTTADELAASHLGDIYAAVGQGRRADQLSGTNPVGLPYGVVPASGQSANLVIAVAGVRFTPTGSRAKTLLEIPMPAYRSALPLSADDVCLNADGLGGSFAMRLGADVEIGNPDLAVQRFKQETASTEGTRMTWENGDLKQLHVELETVFPRDWLIPLDAQGQSTGERATASFSFARTPDEGVTDWVAEGTLQRSELAAAPGFIVPETPVYFDNSAVRNANGMTFPDGYEGVTGTIWTGLYAESFPLQLPDAIRTFSDPATRIEATVSGSFVIDNQGVSVKAGAQDLIASAEGDLGGWGYGIDDFALEVQKNALVEGAMTGGLRLPLFKGDIPYNATLTSTPGGELDYTFLLGGADSGIYPSDLWQSQILLQEGTSISVEYKGGEFVAEAVLHGELGIIGRTPDVDVTIPRQTLTTPGFDLDVGDQSVGVPGQSVSLGGQQIQLDGQTIKLAAIPFEGFTLRSKGPDYVDEGTWSKGTSDFGYNLIGGFPIKIHEIGVSTRPAEGNDVNLGLSFRQVGLFLPGMETTQLFTASSSFTLWSKIAAPSGESVPVASHDGFEIDQVTVVGGIAKAFHLDGQIIFFRPGNAFGEEYGEGVAGNIRATVMRSAQVEVEVIFGTKEGTDYWFFNGGGFLRTGVLLEPISQLKLFGLRGGAYYHMSPPEEWTDKAINFVPEDPPRRAGQAWPAPDPGDTGINFTVDSDVPFGFRAGMTLGLASPSLFSGDLNVDFAFNRNTGVEQVTLNGKAFLLSKGRMKDNITQRESTAQGIADVSLSYNVPDETFTGTFGAILQPYNGLFLAQGKAKLHIDGINEEYFFQLGDPAENWFQMPALGGFAKAELFLYAGNTAPARIRPVSAYCNSAEFAFGQQSPLCSPNYTTIPPSTGTGFLMGLGASAGFSGEFAIFYGALDAAVGATLNLRKVGAATCQGSGAVPGANGFYARGQLFAGLRGEVGVAVNIPLIYVGRLPIVQVGVATELSGALPNPTWAKGDVAGAYSVLGGLVEGRFDYHFSTGEVCELGAGQALAGIEALGDVSPRDREEDVSVFVQPSAAFNMNVNEVHTIETQDGESADVRVKAEADLYRGGSASGPKVPGSTSVQGQGSSLLFAPDEALEEYTEYTFSIEMYAEEKNADGRWIGATDENGNATPTETRLVTFTTGPRPQKILAEHVERTAPLDRKRYYLPYESDASVRESNGITFTSSNIDYGYLEDFTAEDRENGAYNVYVAVHYKTIDRSGGGSSSFKSPWVRFENGRVTWGQPDLEPSTTYKVELIRHQRLPFNLVFERLFDEIKTTESRRNQDIAGDSEGTARTRDRSIVGSSIKVPGQETIYSYHFRTSRYDNVSQKVAGLYRGRSIGNFFDVEGLPILSFTGAVEPFEQYDLHGKGSVGPQITFEFGQVRRPTSQSGTYLRDYARPVVFGVPMPDDYDWTYDESGKDLFLLANNSEGPPPLQQRELVKGGYDPSYDRDFDMRIAWGAPSVTVREHKKMKAYLRSYGEATRNLGILLLNSVRFFMQPSEYNDQLSKVSSADVESFFQNDAQRKSYRTPSSYSMPGEDWLRIESTTAGDSGWVNFRF